MAIFFSINPILCKHTRFVARANSLDYIFQICSLGWCIAMGPLTLNDHKKQKIHQISKGFYFDLTCINVQESLDDFCETELRKNRVQCVHCTMYTVHVEMNMWDLKPLHLNTFQRDREWSKNKWKESRKILNTVVGRRDLWLFLWNIETIKMT